MNKQISAVEASVLKESGEATFLDVREEAELAICKIEGAVHIPTREIPEKQGILPKDKPVVVFCHHGMRSLKVQEFLTSKGFSNIINMEGGIHAWSCDVDTRVAQY